MRCWPSGMAERLIVARAEWLLVQLVALAVRKQISAVPSEAGNGHGFVATGDQLVNADAAELGKRAPFVAGGVHQIQVERGQQHEDLAAVTGIHADEHLVEQDDPGCFRNCLGVLATAANNGRCSAIAFSPPDRAPFSFLVSSCQPVPLAWSTLTTNWCHAV
jgi:hypothetical protein